VRLASLGCAVLLGFALTGCAGAGESEDPPHVRAIEARNRHLEAQFGAGNLLGVADVYTDDAVMVDARGQRTRGREEIDAYWSAIESPVEWRLEIRSIRGSDAVAYELGTSRLSTRRDGELHTSVSQFLLVWRHEPDGEWRIELDAFWPAP
jgi:uncharacterized protein (TIGR02246 family)